MVVNNSHGCFKNLIKWLGLNDISQAILRHFSAAGPGPVSMMIGSVDRTVAATILPLGVSPRSLPACSEPINTADAPSTMPEELPGV